MSRLTNEQPEDRALESLLDDALNAKAIQTDDKAAASTDLADRIFAQTVDLLPKCSTQRLLDEAMPARAPKGLASRIYDETVEQLPGRAVIAKIGFLGLSWPQWRTVAAAFLFGSSMTIFLLCGLIKHEAQAITDARREIVAMSDYTGPDASIDQEIDSLMVDFELALAGDDTLAVNRQMSNAFMDLETELRFGPDDVSF